MLAESQVPMVIVWATFAALAVAGMAALLIWAVRTRQFSGQNRARRLALQSGIPDQPKPSAPQPPPAADAKE